MFNIEYAHSPVFINEDGSCIFMMVKFFEFNEELPFNETTYDPHDHGRELHTRALAGEFGNIAPYVALTPASDQPHTTGSQTL